jgi:hypothetical protein
MDAELTEAFSEQNTLFTPPAPQWGDIVRMTFRIIPNKYIHRLYLLNEKGKFFELLNRNSPLSLPKLF